MSDSNCHALFSKDLFSTRIVREHKGSSIIDFPDTYVVVDVETTGLSPSYDDIIEIGAVKIVGGKISDTFSSLIKPRKAVDSFITELSGITNDMLSDAPSIDSVVPSFFTFIGDSIILAHNAHFDINFLYDALKNKNLILDNDFVDTLRLARNILPDLKHHTLNDLCDYFHIPQRNLHRSLIDCHKTVDVYNCLRSNLDDVDLFKSQFTANGKKKSQHSSSSLKGSDFVQNVSADKDSPIFGKVIVFTGTLERFIRKDAMSLVASLGGICAYSVTSKTNYLVLGNNDYCTTIKDGKSSKHKKAEKYKLAGQDIEIIPEDVFYNMIIEQ